MRMFVSTAEITSADRNEKTSLFNDALVQIFSFCLRLILFYTHPFFFFNHFHQIYIKVMENIPHNPESFSLFLSLSHNLFPKYTSPICL